jgi:hypothetical protein
MPEHESDIPIPEAPIGERTLTEILFLLRRPFPRPHSALAGSTTAWSAPRRSAP